MNRPAPLSLLQPGDPDPVEVLPGTDDCPVVLVCEHAGQAIPAALGDLGLRSTVMQTHIAWDIGAEAVSRLLALRLGAPLVMQRYSRLVIDCNRPPDSETAMPEVSDRVRVPANQGLSTARRRQRITEIFEPFQAAVSTQLARPATRAVLSVHSFTRTLAGQTRPWDIGFLFRKDRATSTALARHFTDILPPERVGMNQPYQIDDQSDWFVPVHGEATGLAHSLIEICNDRIATAPGQHVWAARLEAAITRSLLKDLP